MADPRHNPDLDDAFGMGSPAPRPDAGRLAGGTPYTDNDRKQIDRDMRALLKEQRDAERERQRAFNGQLGQQRAAERDKQKAAADGQRFEDRSKRDMLAKEAAARKDFAGQLRQLRDQEKARVAGIQGHFGRAAGLAVAGAGVVNGFKSAGFSGTVEGNRLALEQQMLAREVAGAFVPAMRLATKATQEFRKWLEGFSKQDQSLLALGTLGVGGAVGANALLKRTAGVGLGTALGTGGLMGASGAAMMARGGLFAAGGAVLGYTPGETLNGAAQLGGAAGALGAYRGGTSVARGALRGAARLAAPVAAAAAAGDGLFGGYYSMLRHEGNNKLTSFLGGLGGGAINTLTGGNFEKDLRAKGRLRDNYDTKPKDPYERHRVTPADAGFDAPGSSYERITTKANLVMGGDTSQDATSLLEDIRNLIKLEVDKGKVPAAPPMKGG